MPLLLSRLHLDVRVHFANNFGVVFQFGTKEVHTEGTLVTVMFLLIFSNLSLFGFLFDNFCGRGLLL